MNIIEAEKLAIKLMEQHGLFQQDWKFSFDANKTAFGCCSYSRKTIFLSAHYTRLNNEFEVKDTILHEIAHAIAGYNAGHGPDWKAICKEIGAKPVATFTDDEAFGSRARYMAVCQDCERQFKSPNKLPLYCQCQQSKKVKTFLNYSDRKNDQ